MCTRGRVEGRVLVEGYWLVGSGLLCSRREGSKKEKMEEKGKRKRIRQRMGDWTETGHTF